MRRKMKVLAYNTPLLVALFIMAAGCFAPFSKDVRGQIEEGVAFTSLASDPNFYSGKVVALGGTVIETKPMEDHTEVEVLEKPLYWDWTPKTDGARGRFILQVDGFLDPAVWKKGRQVTVAAEMIGSRDGKIGMKPYRYPVLKAIEWKLWTNVSQRCCYPSNPYCVPYGGGQYRFGAYGQCCISECGSE